MMAARKPPSRDAGTSASAERLHRAAIRLLRLLRLEDGRAGYSAPRLSALSVLVFRGPQTLATLALAEQVSRPTMTALVQAMEREGLVLRSDNPEDARSFVIEASTRGRQLMLEGRERRVERLAGWIARLDKAERAVLERAGAVIGKLGEAPTSPRAGSTPRAAASGPRPRRARRPR